MRYSKCKPVLPRLSLGGNLDKPLMSLYGPNGGSVIMDSVLFSDEKEKEKKLCKN
jgi:hypothetical protein